MTANILSRYSIAAIFWAISLVTSGGSVLFPSYAKAESAARVIEEVVVTARRREETAQTVPIPISALSSDYLEERGITEIQNIEQVTPNLAFVDSISNSGAAQIFLRGIGQVN